MQSPFESASVPKATDVIIVNDFFCEEMLGGAELTTEAIIDELRSRDLKIAKIRSETLTPQLVYDNRGPLWIICNFTRADVRALSSIVRLVRYIVIEYDFKFCSARSPEKHKAETGKACQCGLAEHGKFVSELFSSAQAVIWMSERQRDITLAACQNMRPRKQMVTSSVFTDATLDNLASLRVKERSAKWIVLRSDSWIKGTKQSLAVAVSKGLDYELVGHVSYDEMLQKLASSSGIVYHPPGGDTCPRLIIEAAILGIQIDINDNVLHVHEPWSALRGDELIIALKKKRAAAADFICNELKVMISGYVTTLDCLSKGYPIIDCIRSMIAFCNEVIVFDGGSTDNTLHLISDSFDPSKVKVFTHVIDMTDPGFALEDGEQKARARAKCMGDFCWQQDADEIVDERDALDIQLMAARMPADINVVCLPVIEFWGSLDKVRVDVTPWKWRLSRNDKNITHGVPRMLRSHTLDGRRIALHGTDGCDMIFKDSGEPVDSATFMTHDADRDRQLALNGDTSALERYDAWFDTVTTMLPSVFHVSWLDINRKLHLYKAYWTAHWASLYGETPKNNFFDKDWDDVSDAEILALSQDLKKIGGWIWHRPWSGAVTPHIRCHRPMPRSITIGVAS